MMDVFIVEIFIKDRWKEKGSFSFQMAEFMTDNLVKIKNVAKDFMFG
jgi:hypothetical protein